MVLECVSGTAVSAGTSMRTSLDRVRMDAPATVFNAGIPQSLSRRSVSRIGSPQQSVRVLCLYANLEHILLILSKYRLKNHVNGVPNRLPTHHIYFDPPLTRPMDGFEPLLAAYLGPESRTRIIGALTASPDTQFSRRELADAASVSPSSIDNHRDPLRNDNIMKISQNTDNRTYTLADNNVTNALCDLHTELANHETTAPDATDTLADLRR